MTTLEEIKQKQTELEAMIKSFEGQWEQEEKFPQIGDNCYWISSYGSVAMNIWNNNNYDKSRYRIHNIFRTQKEAEFALEQLKVIAELKRCGGVFNRARNDSIYYIIWFEHISRTLSVVNRIGSSEAPIFMFPTEEKAQEAIDTIGEERLMKYWFCVEV